MANVFIQGMDMEDLQQLIRLALREEISKFIPPQQDEKLLSPKEARKIWQPAVSLVTIDKWEKEGHLTAHWYGGRKFYRLSEILAAAKVLQPYKKKGGVE